MMWEGWGTQIFLIIKGGSQIWPNFRGDSHLLTVKNPKSQSSNFWKVPYYTEYCMDCPCHILTISYFVTFIHKDPMIIMIIILRDLAMSWCFLKNAWIGHPCWLSHIGQPSGKCDWQQTMTAYKDKSQ